MTAESYTARVLAHLPQATPLRAQIAMELRAGIDERLTHGEPLADVLRQLGDPVALAESYLAAVPLVPAPLGRRVLAKLIDVLTVVAVVGVPAAAAIIFLDQPYRIFAAAEAIIVALVGYAVYTVLAEWTRGRTLGKRIAGLHVVAESGAPVSLGQAVVRLLPLLLQIAWIDALAMVFTERRQRLFEMLSKTRVVCAGPLVPGGGVSRPSRASARPDPAAGG